MTADTPRPERVTLTNDEPTEDGWYAYDGGRQTMIFRLTRGQWYVTSDSGQCDPCEWGYIEQALSVWKLVALAPTAREQALRDQIAGQIEAEGFHEPAMDGDEWYVAGWREATEHAAHIARGETP